MKKTVDLFGCESIEFVQGAKKKEKTLFDDYDGFLDKFEPKKTTDDCFTPPEVFDCVMRYVSEKVDIRGRKVVRPFFPGGDYENVDYPDNCIVIDNPPFSIISKICRFYISRNIDFFLFAPHLTLFSSDLECTSIVCGADITYENGAKVKTSFLSNMLGDIRVIGDAMLYEELMAINEKKKIKLPKYCYPESVLTVSMVSWVVERGISIKINKNDLVHCRGLDSQKKYKKGVFGCGFLLSEKAAAEKAAAEKAAAEKAAAEKAAAEKAAAEKENVIVWELSEREKNIIKAIGE